MLIDHQAIYDDFIVDLTSYMIKGNDTNRALNAHFRKLARHYNRVHQEELAEAVADAVKGMVEDRESKPMTEEERADAVIAFLDTRLKDKTITAAEIGQLKDLVNMKLEDRDVIINIVNYKDIKN